MFVNSPNYRNNYLACNFQILKLTNSQINSRFFLRLKKFQIISKRQHKILLKDVWLHIFIVSIRCISGNAMVSSEWNKYQGNRNASNNCKSSFQRHAHKVFVGKNSDCVTHGVSCQVAFKDVLHVSYSPKTSQTRCWNNKRVFLKADGKICLPVVNNNNF